MPRYFFSTTDHLLPSDAVGIELAGPDISREEAAAPAGGILNDLDGALWRGGAWRMHVTDEKGRTVCRLTFTAEKGEQRRVGGLI